MNIESGGVVFFQTRVCILATGGAGRIYQSTTNAFINTGDGFGMALRAGIPLQDMEMLPVFFHESRFMPNAISSQDAIGIGQIRPAAIKDVEKEMIPILGNLINHNIPD